MQSDENKTQTKENNNTTEDITCIVLSVICLITIGVVSVALVDSKFRLLAIQLLIVLISGGASIAITLSFLNACWKMVKALNKINSNIEEIKNQNSAKTIKIPEPPKPTPPPPPPTPPKPQPKPETIKLNCPMCQKLLHIDKTYKGTFYCPECQQKLQIE